MRAAAAAIVLVVTFAAPALAQAPPTDRDTATSEPEPLQAPEPEPEPPIDATKLGVSMSRIQRGLRISEAREDQGGSGLTLEYQVQVFGTAPRIDILQGFDVGTQAPLQYGAPTHQDFLNQWTPQAYRSPPMPLSTLAGWALFQLVKRSDTSKCEREIAEYRALVMQGVPAPAPRCTQ